MNNDAKMGAMLNATDYAGSSFSFETHRSTTSHRPSATSSVPGVAVATAVAMSTVLALVYLFASRAGLYGEHVGVDWAHHMATLDVMHSGRSPADHWPQLGEFMGYPRSAYWPAVWLSRLFSISTLQSFQIIGALSVFASMGLSALILLRMIGYRTPASLAGLGTAFAVLVAFATLGLTHYANLAFNAFYTQSVATAVALASFVLLQVLARRSHLLVVVLSIPALSAATASFHLTPALWLAGSGLALVLAHRAPLYQLVVAALTVTALGAAAIYFTPGTAMALDVASITNGAGGVAAHGFLVSDRIVPMLGAYVLVGLAILLLSVMAWRKAGWNGLQDEVLSSQAGTIGLLGVATLLVAHLAITDPVGYYSLAKYASLCSVFAALTVGCLVRDASLYAKSCWNEGAVSSHVTTDRPFRACLAVATLFLAQGFQLPASNFDQSHLIALQTIDKGNFSHAEGAAPPVLDVDQLSLWEKYYFAISILANPRGVVHPLILDGGSLGSPFDVRVIHPARLNRLIQPWSGQRLRVGDPAIDQFFVTRLAIRPVEPWGRWVAGSRLEYLGQIALTIDAEGMGICLETSVPSTSDVPSTETLLVSFDAGGGAQAVAFGPERREATVFVPLPDSLPPSGEFVLAVENVENVHGPVEPESSEIGVGLVSMWLAQSTCG